MKNEPKKHPMTMSMAARLLEKEHPEVAFSAGQLRSMARRRAIPCLEIEACGTIRTKYNMVYYPELVKHLLRCKRDVFSS